MTNSINFVVACLIFAIFHSLNAKGQNRIQGKIVDHKGQGISNVTITYRETSQSPLLGFTRSNENGAFVIPVDIKNKQFVLTLSHLAYVKIDTILNNISASFNFTLVQNSQHLDEVKVKLPPISKTKDTLNFLADSFTSKQDRSIADVIAKLPGIEFDGEKILYQGKPIQKYMVNNLDLMEGRYGLINNNLPAGAVKKIQIIENNQPIKILDSVVVSDRASLNLELKKFTTTGTGKIGLGSSPMLWEGNLTPMTFNKSFQSVHSLQSNNIGNDISRELNNLAIAGNGLINTSAAIVPSGQTYLDLKNTSVPEFDERRWLDNHIVLGASNLLIKYNNDIQVKANISYYNDQQRRQGATITKMFVPGGVVQLLEDINNRYSINNLRTGFVVEKNVKKLYLKNDFQLRKHWSDDNGRIDYNRSGIIEQQKFYRDLGLVNKLNAAKYVGKQLISFNSSIIYTTTPQSLTILPGQFIEIFNNDHPYSLLTQNVHVKSLNTDNHFTFSRALGKFLITPRFGVNIASSKLTSNILIDNNSQNLLSTDFENQQKNWHMMSYFHSSFQYKKDHFSVTLSLPYTFHTFNVNQLGISIIDKQTTSTFNPNFSAQLEFNKKHQLVITSGYNTQFDDLSSLYSAFIVTTYRDISRYSAKIRQTDYLNSSVQYKFSDTYHGIFANVGYHYDNRQNNFIIRNIINEIGLRTITVENTNSSSYTQGVSGNISKLFSNLNTVVKLKGSYDVGKADYLINDGVGRIKLSTYASGLEVNNNSLQNLTFQYKVFWNKAVGKMFNRNLYSFNTIRHDVNASIFPISNHSLNLNGVYYVTQSLVKQKRLFIDLMYRWSFIKSKVELELTTINVLNKRNYVQPINNSYALTESLFLLRPRQFLTSVRFRF